jgi:hypothetical protein
MRRQIFPLLRVLNSYAGGRTFESQSSVSTVIIIIIIIIIIIAAAVCGGGKM